jgi:hypothetical protein
MTEETAKLLIEALNRFASAIEKVTGGLGGIHIYHHGMPSYPAPIQPWQPPYGPTWTSGSVG